MPAMIDPPSGIPLRWRASPPEIPMASYPRLKDLMSAAQHDGRWDEIAAYLVGVWIDDYMTTADATDIVETTDSSFSYLFDIEAERLLAAWGISRGRHGGARDAGRMAGHPKAGGIQYHRGHAIPHTLGGPTDINLVPQLGSVNIGPFRRLERQAVSTPGAFYFTYWTYLGSPPVNGFPGQIPTGVDQGLLILGRDPQISHHDNRAPEPDGTGSPVRS